MGRRRSGIQASSMSWSRGPQSILSRLPGSFFRSLEGPRARGIAHGVDIPHAPLIPLTRTHSCGHHTELQRSWEIWLVTLGRKQLGERYPLRTRIRVSYWPCCAAFMFLCRRQPRRGCFLTLGRNHFIVAQKSLNFFSCLWNYTCILNKPEKTQRNYL